MREIPLQVDGKQVRAREGMTILEAATDAGISIPTLCHHERLEPFGGCRICVDVCPTKVLAFDEEKFLAVVGEAEDCIACLSCAYECPSGAITHAGYAAVKNFYRDLDFCGRMERFL